MEQKKKRGFKWFVQIAALLLMLVVFPFLSLQYLRGGYYERKNALDQLEDYGKIPAFELTTQTGNNINTTNLRGKYTVIGQIESFQEDLPLIEEGKRLFETFGNSKQIAIYTYVENYDTKAIQDFVTSITKDTLSRWYFLEGEDKISTVFKDQEANTFALVDTSLTIRNFYDANNSEEINLLAKHIAMFVEPLKRRAEIEFKREKEK